MGRSQTRRALERASGGGQATGFKGQLEQGRAAQPGRGPSCSPVLAVPTVPFWPRPRPDTCSNTGVARPGPAPCRHGGAHCMPARILSCSSKFKPGTHHPLVLLFSHPVTCGFTNYLTRLETQTQPWPTTSLDQLPAGSMNNSLLSFSASNIYPLRFPALCSLGEGPPHPAS